MGFAKIAMMKVHKTNLHRAMLHVDNAYNVPKVDVKGYCCKTNLQSNTAFRGFGGPQGLLIVENYMDELACELDIDPAGKYDINMIKLLCSNTFYPFYLKHETSCPTLQSISLIVLK